MEETTFIPNQESPGELQRRETAAVQAIEAYVSESMEEGTPRHMAMVDYLFLLNAEFFVNHNSSTMDELESSSRQIGRALQRSYDTAVAEAAAATTLIHQRRSGPGGRDYRAEQTRFKELMAAYQQAFDAVNPNAREWERAKYQNELIQRLVHGNI